MRKMFVGELLIMTSLLQIFVKSFSIFSSKVIVKSIIDSDNNFLI